MKRLISLALLCGACGSSPAPTVPTSPAPSVPSCQVNNTALVKFENRSATYTHDVFLDGLRMTTLTPGQQSQAYTVSAGVPHELQFRITNTTQLACTISSPTPAQCSMPLYFCAGPGS